MATFKNLRYKTTGPKYMDRIRDKYGDKFTVLSIESVKSPSAPTRTNITFVCPDHGEQTTRIDAFLRKTSFGCGKCGEHKPNRRQAFETKYVALATAAGFTVITFGENENGKTVIHGLCATHGKWTTYPDNALKRGTYCKQCSFDKSSAAHSTVDWIVAAKKKHGDKYTYRRVLKQRGSKPRLEVICPIHGLYNVDAASHARSGVECFSCSKEAQRDSQRYTLAQWSVRAKAIHGDKFKYTSLHYVNNLPYLQGVCLVHNNPIDLLATNHIDKRQGCATCKSEGIKKALTKSLAEWRIQCVATHGTHYTYTAVTRINGSAHLEIICPEHGKFTQHAYSHAVLGQGCPTCNVSALERSVGECLPGWIKATIPGTKLELDFYNEKLNSAVEVNGEYIHSAMKKPIHYHLNKYTAARKAGINLFQIWGFDWNNPERRDIIQSMLQLKNHQIQRKVPAKACLVANVPYDDAVEFLEQHHLDGRGKTAKSDVILGLYKDKELLALVSTNRRPYKNGKHEIKRMVTKKYTLVQGGFSRLLSYLPKGDYFSWVSNDLGGAHTQYNILGWIKQDKIPSASLTWVSRSGHKLSRFAMHRWFKAESTTLGETVTEFAAKLPDRYLPYYNAGNTMYAGSL